MQITALFLAFSLLLKISESVVVVNRRMQPCVRALLGQIGKAQSANPKDCFDFGVVSMGS